MRVVNNHQGFTLVELLITIAIAAILAAVALPSFKDLFTSERITSSANNVMAQVTYLRSEALKTGYSVMFCRSSNGTSCAGKVTSATVTDWSSGYLAFVVNTPILASDSLPRETDTLVLVNEAIAGSKLYFSHGDQLLIANNGLQSMVNFYSCPESGAEDDALKVELILSGQAEIAPLSSTELEVCS